MQAPVCSRLLLSTPVRAPGGDTITGWRRPLNYGPHSAVVPSNLLGYSFFLLLWDTFLPLLFFHCFFLLFFLSFSSSLFSLFPTFSCSFVHFLSCKLVFCFFRAHVLICSYLRSLIPSLSLPYLVSPLPLSGHSHLLEKKTLIG